MLCLNVYLLFDLFIGFFVWKKRKERLELVKRERDPKMGFENVDQILKVGKGKGFCSTEEV